MAARSLASLTLSFGLVNVPVKLYSATESSSSVRFNQLAKDGSRLRQQYVSDNARDGRTAVEDVTITGGGDQGAVTVHTRSLSRGGGDGTTARRRGASFAAGPCRARSW